MPWVVFRTVEPLGNTSAKHSNGAGMRWNNVGMHWGKVGLRWSELEWRRLRLDCVPTALGQRENVAGIRRVALDELERRWKEIALE